MTDNRENKCEYCSTTCRKCEPQHHQNMTVKHYEDTGNCLLFKEGRCPEFNKYNLINTWKFEKVKIIPIREIEEILRLSVCDDIRKIAGKWLK